MKQNSTKNTWVGSDGTRYTSAQVERYTTRAKKAYLENFVEDHRYPYCEDCHRNDCVPIDVSHEISVDECKKRGMVEKAWDLGNMKLRGRSCHRKHDKTFIGRRI